MPESIHDIADRLYAETPAKRDILFHYTSVAAMQSIFHDRLLRASDIHFFSDAAELRHLTDSLRAVIGKPPDNADGAILGQLKRWLPLRLLGGPMICAVSFTVQGDLLSQWRAYSPPSKGVSLGFSPNTIVSVAMDQGFRLGKCIYDKKVQEDLIQKIIDLVLVDARKMGSSAGGNSKEWYYPAFQRVETSLLRIGALFKHPAFREENEWRVVSPVIGDLLNPEISYREGTSTLVPFVEFKLRSGAGPAPLHRCSWGRHRTSSKRET